MSVEAYTDGSCMPNPGAGGWAWIWFSSKDPRVVFTGSGGCKKSTNNRMELFALIDLLRDIYDTNHLNRIKIHIDSQYVIKSLISGTSGPVKFINGKPEYTGYAKGWNLGDSLKINKRLNIDLWRDLHGILTKLGAKQIDIELCWVKGHNNNPGNELVDQLAKKAVPKKIGNN